MSPGEAIILGLVQGLTEFLPISSSGHLVLARTLFGIEIDFALALDAVLHLATALAVILYFWSDIKLLIQAGLRKLSRLPVDKKEERFLYALIVGTLPAAGLGLFFESYLAAAFSTPLFVVGALFVSAIFFAVAESFYLKQSQQKSLTTSLGFKIGLFQAAALLPGVSRSGATIGAGILLGLSRLEAARFSFLLAIPIILGVGLKKSLDFARGGETGVEGWAIGLSALTAFLSALLVIHVFLAFIRRYSLWPFVWYSALLAVSVLVIDLLG